MLCGSDVQHFVDFASYSAGAVHRQNWAQAKSIWCSQIVEIHAALNGSYPVSCRNVELHRAVPVLQAWEGSKV